MGDALGAWTPADEAGYGETADGVGVPPAIGIGVCALAVGIIATIDNATATMDWNRRWAN